MTRRTSARIRRKRVGDIGWVFYRQAVVYKEEFGYSDLFERYLAEGFSPFLEHFDPRRDGLWMAESAGRKVGFIAAQHVDSRRDWAWLRWFLVEKGLRRRGIGTRLMRTALEFCRRAGYRGVFLWTVDDLDEARRVYERAGFTLAVEKKGCPWSPGHREQRWDKKLR